CWLAVTRTNRAADRCLPSHNEEGVNRQYTRSILSSGGHFEYMATRAHGRYSRLHLGRNCFGYFGDPEDWRHNSAATETKCISALTILRPLSCHSENA